jgi:uncharacterized protein (TIGR02001 family)
MNKTHIALASALIASVTTLAQAQSAAPAAAAPTPDWTITGNLSLASDYRFRGISQTNKQPALSGGFDVAHSSGFYIGNWNSNIDSDFFQGANIEMDFYGGYKGSISDIGYDIGAIYYYYPGSGRDGRIKVKNTELYVGTSYGPVSAKFYYPLNDFFNAEQIFPGGGNAGGSYYIDLSGAYDLGSGFGVNAHVGFQKLKGSAKVTEIGKTAIENDIVDWKIGFTYGFSNGFVAAVSYIDTNRNLAGVTRNVSNGTGVVSLSKTF